MYRYTDFKWWAPVQENNLQNIQRGKICFKQAVFLHAYSILTTDTLTPILTACGLKYPLYFAWK
jgi:hypothetical protein